MSSFKTINKVKKKEDLNTRVTLDALHNDKIKEFNQNNTGLKKLEMELVLLNKKMKNIEKKKMSELSQDEIEGKFDPRDKIETLARKLI